MVYRPRIYLPDPIERKHLNQMRDVVKESRDLLKQPVPDTFLGRTTQEPFPVAEDAENPLSEDAEKK